MENPSENDASAEKQRSLFRQAGWFLAVFLILQTAWNASLNTPADDFLVGTLTVSAAVAVIQIFSPSSGTVAVGRKIVSPRGGINIGNGCEGTSVFFLLVAAILASSATWRHKLKGLLTGLALVYLLNQCRVIALFYTYRSDRPLFELLHHIIAPLAMIIAVGLFFLAWTMRHAE